MRILIVNTEYMRGGAAQIARILHNDINNIAGFQSYFAYGRGKEVTDQKVFKFAFPFEIYLHAFITRLTGLQGYGTYLSTKKLERFILKEKFNLIHLHNIHGYYLDLSLVKFLGKINIPIVWTLHDGWPLTGRCAYTFKCDRWKTGCGNCPNLSLYPKTYFDTSAFMWNKKKEIFTSGWNPVIVSPSQWLANKVKGSYLKKFRVKIIPNGIDTNFFKPKDKKEIRRKLKVPIDKKVILFVAADLKDERKGVKYLVKALNYIKADNWILLTVGKKINFNVDVKVPNTIIQFGYIADETLLSDIYNVADVFCISSLDDNFPNTVLESMSSGVPVVGFKVGGIPEQVTEDCGILVEPKDAKSLGKALEKVINDREIRGKFSQNSRKRALEKFSIDKFVGNYIALYNNLIKKKGGL